MTVQYYFSGSVMGVFNSKLKKDYEKNGTWPSDVKLITNEQYIHYFKEPNRPNGKELGVIDGLPAWVDIAAPSNEELISVEKKWQQSQLTKTSTAIVHYESDAKIPDIYSELRVTIYTEDDYYALLGDRKLLVEYLQQEDFPECGRPILSGLTSPIATQPS